MGSRVQPAPGSCMTVKPIFSAGCIGWLLAAAALPGYGQGLNAARLLAGLDVPAVKFDEWAQKRRFYPFATAQNGDTLMREWHYRAEIRKKKPVDTVQRVLLLKEWKSDFTLTYRTGSAAEMMQIVEELRLQGFYSHQEADPLREPVLLQHRDMTAATWQEPGDSLLWYGISFQVADFPDPREIRYADDLLAFTSHEYLAYYFGEQAVKKDIYQFSPDLRTHCSVLFPNTARQVVFIWKDGANYRTVDQLLFGSQPKLLNTPYTAGFVAENNWMSRSGLHAGMTLYQLRLLNGSDLRFFGGRSAKSGLVLPEKTGKLDFGREQLILGCVNCTDPHFAQADILQADDALSEGRILFVLSMVLTPENAAAADPGLSAAAITRH